MAANAELIQALKEWKDEIVTLTRDYEKAIQQLATIEQNFKRSWWDYAQKLIPYVAQLATVIFILGFLAIFSSNLECGLTLRVFPGIEIAKQCG